MKTWLAVAALAFLLTVPWLGITEFYTRGEPREALVIQNIAESGNWILPQGYNGAVPSKPPFMHWISAALSLPGGEVTEFTARLPSALASLLFLVYFSLFLEKRLGKETALLSAVILMTSVEWFRHSVAVRVDMVLSAMTATALLLLYEWFEKDFKGYPFLAMLFLAGATLTKGPVGVVLPGAALGLFLLFRGNSFWRSFSLCFRVCFPALCMALFWYVAAALERPGAFLDKFYYENVQRLMGTQEDEPHKHSAFFLYASLIPGLLPWFLVAFGPIVNGLRNLRKENLRLGSFFNLSALTQFFVSIVFVFIIFYSLPAGKRSVYLLPVYPFLSVALARCILEKKEAALRWLRGVAFFLAVAVLLVSLAVAALSWRWDHVTILAGMKPRFAPLAFYSRALAQGFKSLPWWLWPCAVLPPVLAFACLSFRKVRAHPLVFSTLIISSVYLCGNAVLLPAYARSISLKKFAAAIKHKVPADSSLYSYGSEFYGVSFYLKRPMYRHEDKKGGCYVVAEENDARPKGWQTVTTGEDVGKPGQRVGLYDTGCSTQ